jgi:hypothetical protein
MRRVRQAAPYLWLAIASSAQAEETTTLQPVVVKVQGNELAASLDAATEGVVTAKSLANRPRLRPAEVLESVPGMIVTQHSGDGKANQYFLRGFNLDHGSDFGTFVNGMPINQVSHAHGQGYTDLNFLIPELVDRVRFRKGSYDAEDGDFGTTGTARIDYVKRLPENFVEMTLGPDQYRRFLVAAGEKRDDGGPVLSGALEAGMTDGPWEQPENLHRINSFFRLSGENFDVTAMTYRATWTATEQVPQRAIDDGEIGRYGTLAPTDGGRTYRDSLSGSWSKERASGTTAFNAYAARYGLNLYSTPSGLQDSQHEQEDRRTTFGVTGDHRWEVFGNSEAAVGLQWRRDRIPLSGLFLTQDRTRTAVVRQDSIREDGIGAFAQLGTQWQPWLRTVLGLRTDHIRARVSSIDGPFNADNGGTAEGTETSPKVSLIFGPFGSTVFYANWGRGFHSNDARGATSTVSPVDGSAIDRVPMLAPATSSELGLRTKPLPGWNTAISLWRTNLSSELVFVGDEGVTEPRGASRRYGLDWSNDYALKDWLTIDGNVAWSHARFVEESGGGTHVPNSIPLSASLGASATYSDWYGGVRLRYIGAYPLEETGTEKSQALFTTNLKVGRRIGSSMSVSVDVLNLFDRKGNDIEYWGTSCTPSEGAGCNGGDGFDGRLVHPMEPRTVRVTVQATF